MNEPLFTIFWCSILVVVAVLLSSAKDFRFSTVQWLMPSLGGGVIFAVVLRYASIVRLNPAIVIASALTLICFFIRGRRPAADWAEGIYVGAVIGAVASIGETIVNDATTAWPLLLAPVVGLLTFATPLRLRRARFAVLVILTAVCTPFVAAARNASMPARDILVAEPAVILIATLVFLLLRQSTVKRELKEEVELGFVLPEDVDWLSNPFTRAFRRRWVDEKARREFARQATALAVHKAEQRSLSSEQARLQQLETIRIRMLLQNALSVELSMRKQAREAANGEPSSDTLDAKG